MAYIHRLDRPRLVIAPHQELKAITFNDGSVQTTASVPIKSIGRGLTLAQDELTTASKIGELDTLTFIASGDTGTIANLQRINFKNGSTQDGAPIVKSVVSPGLSLDIQGALTNTNPTAYSGSGVNEISAPLISGVNTLTFSDNTTMATAPSLNVGNRTVYTQASPYTATNRTIETELLQALQWVGSSPFTFEFDFRYTGTVPNPNLTTGSRSKLFEAFQLDDSNSGRSGFGIMLEDSVQSHLRLYVSTNIQHANTYYTFTNTPTLPELYSGNNYTFVLRFYGATQNHLVELYINTVKMIPHLINGTATTPVPVPTAAQSAAGAAVQLYNWTDNSTGVDAVRYAFNMGFVHGTAFASVAVLDGDANITDHAITNMKLTTTTTTVVDYVKEIRGTIFGNTKVYGSMYVSANSPNTTGNHHKIWFHTLNNVVEFASPDTLFALVNDQRKMYFPRPGFYHVVATVYGDARYQAGGAATWHLEAFLNDGLFRQLTWHDGNTPGQDPPDNMKNPTLTLSFNIQITSDHMQMGGGSAAMTFAARSSTTPTMVVGDSNGTRTTSVHVHNID